MELVSPQINQEKPKGGQIRFRDQVINAKRCSCSLDSSLTDYLEHLLHLPATEVGSFPQGQPTEAATFV